MITIRELLEGPQVGVEVNGKIGMETVWEPALPYPGPWSWRLRDAWEVLQGRATAIRRTPNEEQR